MVVSVESTNVLDVGCGSGPLFEPLARRGTKVTGIDPAPAMVELAVKRAEEFPGLVNVEQRGWEQIEERDVYDAAVALGVYDYVENPRDLIARMGRAARHVIASFPSPGPRVALRKVRYGAHGVGVYGYTAARLTDLAAGSGLYVDRLVPLGHAGHLALFSRRTA
jgi:2-polyprenyl-3-methyl-5-hydroxy-6-metoxy-1,4-benzoquinol methylase